MFLLILGVVIPFSILGLIIALVAWMESGKPKKAPRYKHNPNHVGLTEGKSDIICPNCNSPYCQYYYEDRQITYDRYKTTTHVHLFNPFKPFVEDKTRLYPGQYIQVRMYRCMNCGLIFK